MFLALIDSFCCLYNKVYFEAGITDKMDLCIPSDTVRIQLSFDMHKVCTHCQLMVEQRVLLLIIGVPH